MTQDNKPHPSRYFGVGYGTKGRYPITNLNGKPNKCYNIWSGMLSRCYNTKHPAYHNYGGRGVQVCSEWHSYQNFARWADNNGYFEGAHLDKDILGNGLLYSPKTCKFVTRQENIEASLAKSYEFVSPSGEVVQVHNLSKFCRENNLDNGAMTKVASGERKSHKKWMLPLKW